MIFFPSQVFSPNSCLQQVPAGQCHCHSIFLSLSIHTLPCYIMKPSHHYPPPYHCCHPQSFQCPQYTDQSPAAAPVGFELSVDTMSIRMTMLHCCLSVRHAMTVYCLYLWHLSYSCVSLYAFSDFISATSTNIVNVVRASYNSVLCVTIFSTFE